jgi:hypothetical protein
VSGIGNYLRQMGSRGANATQFNQVLWQRLLTKSDEKGDT